MLRLQKRALLNHYNQNEMSASVVLEITGIFSGRIKIALFCLFSYASRVFFFLILTVKKNRTMKKWAFLLWFSIFL